MSGNGWVALPDVREWSGGLPGCSEAFERPHGYPGVVESPSWMSGSGLEALPDVRELSGDPLECPGVVGRPCRR